MNKIKKILCLTLATLTCALTLGSCEFINGFLPGESSSQTQPESSTTQPEVSSPEEEVPQIKTYKLTVMSCNLDQAEGSNASKRKMIYNNIIDVLPDLLGVQEETPAWQDYLEDKLESEGYARVGEFRATQGHHAYYAFREASSIYYNVDRFTLKDSGTFWLSDTPDVEGSVATGWDGAALFPRVCTWVVVQDKRSGEEMAFFNSHFSYEAEKIRNESAKLILSKIEEKGIPAFFSGDLNFASNEETDTYEVITAKMEDSRTVAKATENGNTFHNYGYGPGQSYGSGTTDTVPIDYIFATKGDFTATSFDILEQQFGLAASEYYSDHFSIVATYEYTKEV